MVASWRKKGICVPRVTACQPLPMNHKRLRGGDINERGFCHVGQVSHWAPCPYPPHAKAVTDWRLSGYLNSGHSSIKVTHIAANVLAEQTMSREADGSGARQEEPQQTRLLLDPWGPPGGRLTPQPREDDPGLWPRYGIFGPDQTDA